jgi:hypothetical protein
VGAPATPQVSGPTVVLEKEREEKKTILDDFDNRTDGKLIRKPLGSSWS